MTSPSTRALDAERFFRDRFEAQADPATAAAQKKYMKSALDFHGVVSATLKAAVADYARQHDDLGPDALRDVALHLFTTSSFDLHGAAVTLLERERALLREVDLDWLIQMIRDAACWAHCDALGTNVIPAPLGGGAAAKRRVRAWAEDPDVWVRRTALLVNVVDLRRREGDFALFTEIAVPMLGDTTFWIRKALGWVLRETSKKRPALVSAFLAAHGDACSGLTRREASKYLPATRG